MLICTFLITSLKLMCHYICSNVKCWRWIILIVSFLLLKKCVVWTIIVKCAFFKFSHWSSRWDQKVLCQVRKTSWNISPSSDKKTRIWISTTLFGYVKLFPFNVGRLKTGYVLYCGIHVLQPVGNPWWNMNIQQLQPTFTQSQFCDNQSGDTTQSTTMTILKSGGAPPSVPQMDICTDDAFIGGSCLKLEADVVYNKFVKYRY